MAEGDDLAEIGSEIKSELPQEGSCGSSDLQIKKNRSILSDTPIGPSVEIRTRGLLNPIQARYQTSPHPDI